MIVAAEQEPASIRDDQAGGIAGGKLQILQLKNDEA